MMTLQDQVSANVRVLAAAHATTPAAIARNLGQSTQWIQAKMAGRNRWYIEDVERIAHELDVEPAILVGAALRLTVVNDSGSRPVEDESRVTVRPKGLEPPTFWLDVPSRVTCGSQSDWELWA